MLLCRTRVCVLLLLQHQHLRTQPYKHMSLYHSTTKQVHAFVTKILCLELQRVKCNAILVVTVVRRRIYCCHASVSHLVDHDELVLVQYSHGSQRPTHCCVAVMHLYQTWYTMTSCFLCSTVLACKRLHCCHASVSEPDVSKS